MYCPYLFPRSIVSIFSLCIAVALLHVYFYVYQGGIQTENGSIQIL